MRHKWNNQGRIGVHYCAKCGYCREYVRGIPTYFRNDTLYDKHAPPCDGLIVGKTEEEMKALLPLMY